MDNTAQTSSCRTMCWIISAVVGLLIAILLWTLRDWGFFSGGLIGLLVFLAGGFLLSTLMCKGADAAAGGGSSADADAQAQGAPAVATMESTTGAAASTLGAIATASDEGTLPEATQDSETAVDAGASDAAADDAAAEAAESDDAPRDSTSAIKPSTELPGTKELAERKGDWKYEKPDSADADTSSPAVAAETSGADVTASAVVASGGMASDAAPSETAPAQAAAAKAPEAEGAGAKKAGSKKPAAKKPAAKKADAKGTTSAAATADDKPATLSAARDGGPDNLKMIKGVGPKMENMLHDMGFFHFDQVASWQDKEVAWVDENLKGFRGRVSRDEWVKQAKILAEGGTTEFSGKVKKGGVY